MFVKTPKPPQISTTSDFPFAFRKGRLVDVRAVEGLHLEVYEHCSKPSGGQIAIF